MVNRASREGPPWDIASPTCSRRSTFRGRTRSGSGDGTADTLEEVLGPGYMRSGASILRPGELIYVRSCPRREAASGRDSGRAALRGDHRRSSLGASRADGAADGGGLGAQRHAPSPGAGFRAAGGRGFAGARKRGASGGANANPGPASAPASSCRGHRHWRRLCRPWPRRRSRRLLPSRPPRRPRRRPGAAGVARPAAGLRRPPSRASALASGETRAPEVPTLGRGAAPADLSEVRAVLSRAGPSAPERRHGSAGSEQSSALLCSVPSNRSGLPRARSRSRRGARRRLTRHRSRQRPLPTLCWRLRHRQGPPEARCRHEPPPQNDRHSPAQSIPSPITDGAGGTIKPGQLAALVTQEQGRAGVGAYPFPIEAVTGCRDAAHHCTNPIGAQVSQMRLIDQHAIIAAVKVQASRERSATPDR